MKRILSFSAFFLLFVLSACQREWDRVDRRFSLDIGLSQVKTTFSPIVGGNIRSIYWTEGDCVSLNGLVSDPLTDIGDEQVSTRFDFEGTPSYPYRVVYPASLWKDASTLRIPSTLDAEVVPMCGYSTGGGGVSLSTFTSFIKLSLNRPSVNPDTHVLRYVRVTARDGGQMSGDFAFDYAHPALERAASASGADTRIQVTPGISVPAEGLEVFVPVPPGSYGITVRIGDVEGHYMEKSTTSAKTFRAGEIVAFPAFDFVPTATEMVVDLDDVPEGDGPVVTPDFTAVVCDAYATADGSVTLERSWKKGDKIRILWEGGSSWAEALGNGPSAGFSVKGDEIPEGEACYYAVYPYDFPAALYSWSDNLTLTWQNKMSTAPEDAAVYVSCVSSPSDTWNFHAAGSLLTFEAAEATGAKMTFQTADRKYVTGEVDYYFNSDGTLSEAALTDWGAMGRSITTAPSVLPGTFCIPLPPGIDLSDGFTVNFISSDDNEIDRMEVEAGEYGRLTMGRILALGDVGARLNQGVIKVLYHNIFLRSYGLNSSRLKRSWDYRKAGEVAMFKGLNPDVFGLNECDYEQRKFIADQLGSAYGWVGLGPQGESGTTTFTDSSNPVFYNMSTLELESWGTFWLSETPDVASYTWGYTSDWHQYRYCTWCRFIHKASGRPFAFFNAHLANGEIGATARENSLALLLDKSYELAGDVPLVIGGDFNSKGSEDYYDDFYYVFHEGRLDCAKHDEGMTHINFVNGNFETVESESLLDHIFYDLFDGMEYAIDRNSWAGIPYISDHYPVWAKLRIHETSQH